MRTLFKNQKFCQDTFEGALPEGFREGAISGMARAAKRSRQIRHGGLAAAVGLALALTVTQMPRRPVLTEMAARAEPKWKVATGPLAPGIIIHSSTNGVVLVNSEKSARFDRISDEQLLALLPDRPVALLKTTMAMEILFLDGGADLTE